MAIFLVWSLLGKKGNSHTEERIDLFTRFLKVIPSDQIICFLGDREFGGEEWFKFLINNGVPFAIRIKSDTLLKHKNGGTQQAKKFFANLKVNEYQSICNKIWTIPINITCLRILNNELLILASSQTIGIDVLQTYKLRWSIERTFLCLKTKGFNFENTHIKDNAKLAKLMAIAALALSIAVFAGVIRNQIKPITIKKHGRALYSIFTYGLDWLRYIILKHCHFMQNYFNGNAKIDHPPGLENPQKILALLGV